MSTPNASPRRPARANASWWWALLIWGVSSAATAGVIRFHHQWGRVWGANGRMAAFETLTPLGELTVTSCTFAMWVVGTAWVVRATGRRLLPFVLAGAIVLVAVTVGYLRVGGLWNERWTLHHRLETADAGAYVAISRLNVIDIEVALGRVREPGVFVETIDIVHACHWALAAPIALTPNDTDVPAGTSLAVLSAGGVAFLEREDGRDEVSAVLAIDADGKRRGLAPFDLFDADDRGDPRDVERWCDWLTTGNRRGKRVNIDALRDALDHANPWVRDAAAQLLAAHAAWEAAQSEVR